MAGLTVAVDAVDMRETEVIGVGVVPGWKSPGGGMCIALTWACDILLASVGDAGDADAGANAPLRWTVNSGL